MKVGHPSIEPIVPERAPSTAQEPPAATASLRALHRTFGQRLDADVELCTLFVRLHALLTQLEGARSACGALQPLEGAVALLRGEMLATPALDARQRRDLTTLVRRLEVLAGNLLHYPPANRLSEAELEVRYDDSDISHAVQLASGAFDVLAQSRQVAYVWDAPKELRGQVDLEKLHTVLHNLLFNAFKNTPPGGRIQGQLTTHDDDTVVVRLTDSGPGVPPAVAATLFDRTVVKEHPTAVGFSLGRSRDLAGLMGGTLDLEHTSPQGTCFVLRLPRFSPPGLPVAHVSGVSTTRIYSDAYKVAQLAKQELEAEETVHRDGAPTSARPLVLIVEDNPSVQRVLVSALSRDYATVSALDGITGLEKALSLKPDLIVLDVMLPRMDGPQLIRAVRNAPEVAEVPILVVTADHTTEQLVRLFESGAQDVIHKPFLLPELKARARNLLWTKKTRDLLNATIGHREMDIVQLATAVLEQQQNLRRAMKELQEARLAAETASQIRGNFLRMISHELKTPLTAMQLQIRMLEQTGASDHPRLQQGLNRVRRSCRRLHHLVETMLEWARINGGRAQAQLSEFDVSALVDEVSAEFVELAQNKSLSLHVTHGGARAPVTSDRQVTRLVLVNVIERAVQITQRGAVLVHVAREGSGYAVSVTDGSPPIPSRLHEELFDPLPRVDDMGRSSGSGSGIGLHVVRDLVGLLGGTVALQSGDAGNTLRMRLPNLTGEVVTVIQPASIPLLPEASPALVQRSSSP